MHPDTVMWDFGAAIAALKRGDRVARAGWNGKGMFVWLNLGSLDPDLHVRSSVVGGVSRNLFEDGDEGTTTRMPNLNMHTADGSTVTGWLASQTDILAEDWTVLE